MTQEISGDPARRGLILVNLISFAPWPHAPWVIRPYPSETVALRKSEHLVQIPYHSFAPMPDPEATWDSTLTLLTRARNGDAQALDDLFARYLPGLRRWASGRLPRWARDLADTPDVVQEVLLETFKRIEGFDCRGEGALRAYLRQAVMNRIREELRRANRRPVRVELDESLIDAGLSPLEAAVGAEVVERYEAALQQFSEGDRELIIARVEMGLTYAELAAATGKPSADAARMAVGRALLKLSEVLGGDDADPTD
jgi:RNA polymerase sigma-70 factor (ECF subfamily)